MKPELYLARYAHPKRWIEEAPHPRLGLVVVIPCYAEPQLLASLDALRQALPPLAAVEVLVVVNGPEGADASVQQANRQTLLAVEQWKRTWQRPDWKVHGLYAPDLPRKHAGVGLARKLGMDEAYRRLHTLDRLQEGVIVCFDADSLCDRNYLTALEEHFQAHPRTPGCSVYYEHPLSGPEPPQLYAGIVGYEVHLRYYVDALRWAGYPYAYQTIGSSMAVRAADYARVQGMNRRKAGEDFYFLHKLIPLGGFTELNATRVIPSPRLSDRVPFGTGRAMHTWMQGPQAYYPTYAPAIFETLAPFFERVLDPDLAPDWEVLRPMLHPVLAAWLAAEGFAEAWANAHRQSTQPHTYRQRLLRWLDGLRILKYVHHAREVAWPSVSTEAAADWLLAQWGIKPGAAPTPQAQLTLLRHRDRQGWTG